MQILFGVFDGLAHRFPSKGKKKMRLMARNSFVSNTKKGLMVKCTPERGHNALFFIPLQVFIML